MGDYGLSRVALVLGLLVMIHRLSVYLWREHRASMQQVIDRLKEENNQLRLDLAAMEGRRDVYRTMAHKLTFDMMGMANQLTVALVERDLARKQNGDPPLLPPPADDEAEG